MAEELAITEQIKRKIYYDRNLTKHRDDKRTRVSVISFLGHEAVEFREHYKVPTSAPGGPDWKASNGMIIPLAEIVALRKVLQKIEADRGLSDD